MLANAGIAVLGMSSDGDSRLLKTMRHVSRLSSDLQHPQWPWFHTCTNPEFLCVQDTVHIGTKLRTRLIKPSILLPFGNYIISVQHLKWVIDHISKDRHLLVDSDINSDDKMNFEAVRKICDPRVSDILKTDVIDSQGTILYLEIMRDVTESFLNKLMSVEMRLYLLWKSVFTLRIWRHWITKSKDFTLKDNFISQNAYLCIEINAHSLILLIQKFSNANNNLNPEWFTTWLMSSQPCEQTFRTARSMTSTLCTAVNFSMLELLHRMNRIQFLQDVKADLAEEFTFPRDSPNKTAAKGSVFRAMTDLDIEEIVRKSLQDAVDTSAKMGIEDGKQYCFRIDVPEVHIKDNDEKDDTDNEDHDADMASHDDINREVEVESGTWTVSSDFYDTEEIPEEEENANNFDDATITDYDLLNHWNSQEGLLLKDFSPDYSTDATNVTPIGKQNQALLKISFPNADPMLVKKSSICWLFSNKTHTISNDRRIRVQDIPNKQVLEKSVENIFRKPTISLGDWCVFKTSRQPGRHASPTDDFVIGMVLSFCNMGQKGKKKQSKLKSVSIDKQNVGCLCSFYKLDELNHLVPFEKGKPQSFKSLTSYELTIPAPIKEQAQNSDLPIFKLDDNYVQEMKKIISTKKHKATRKRATNSTTDLSSDSSDESDHKQLAYDNLTSPEKSENSEEDSDSLPIASTSTPEQATSKIHLHCENYYAVFYEEQWYIGRILKIIDQETTEIKFLKQEMDTFIWPKKDDQDIVKKEHIFYGPITLKGSVPMTISRIDRLAIQKKFKFMKRDLRD